MAENPFEFLQDWVREHVSATAYDDRSTAEHLAGECVRYAQEAGFSETSITKAAGGNLIDFIEGKLNSAADREVQRLVDKDKS